jgi:hypothetical protein
MTTDTIKLWESEETGSQFMIFSFSKITDATDNFSTESKLGEGGFGPVYKVPYVLHSRLFTYLAISKTKQNKNVDYLLCTIPGQTRGRGSRPCRLLFPTV